MAARLKGATRTLTMTEAAAVLNIAGHTLKSWIDQGCPHQKIAVTRGRGIEYQIDVGAVMRWREKRAVEALSQQFDDLTADEARRRKLIAEAALIGLELAKAKGEVAVIADYEKVRGTQYARVRARLLAGPVSVSAKVVHLGDLNAVKLVLESWADECLRELSGFAAESLASGLSGDVGEPEAGAAADSL